MINHLNDFVNEHKSFEKLISVYFQGYVDGQNFYNSKINQSRLELSGMLDQVEFQQQQQITQTKESVSRAKNLLNSTLNSVKSVEATITDKRYFKFRDSFQVPDVSSNDEPTHYTSSEVDEQVRKTNELIFKLKKLKSIPKAYSFISKNYREGIFKEIIINIKKLETMIELQKNEHDATFANKKRDIDREASEQVSLISNSVESTKNQITSEKQEYLRKLKILLLDGIKECLENGESYERSAEWIKEYLDTYVENGVENSEVKKLFLGFLNHNFNVRDDGTIESYLSQIFDNRYYYNNGMMLVPVALDEAYEKPICIKYGQGLNTYSLFKNYALQMLNIFNKYDASIYLVDCANMGSQYSSFAGAENDDQCRINIVRSKEALKTLLDELSEYIIETNSEFLKDTYTNVIEYNKSSTVKRPVKAVFFSNISELEDSEMLAKLELIARNGNRSGVYSFIGVPDEELNTGQASSQERVNTVQSIIGLCDVLNMNSDTELEIAEGGCDFAPPSKINEQVERRIMERAVADKR